MNLIHPFLLLKIFFALNDDEAMGNARKDLAKQVFQLAYFGHISPEYAASLEVSERNYMYKLLSEQKKDERKAQEDENRKMKSKMPSRSTPRVSRR